MQLFNGRLIMRFTLVLRRLNTIAVAAADNYDPYTNELIPTSNGSHLGTSGRVEEAAIRIPCQIDRDPDWSRYQQLRSGLNEQTALILQVMRVDLDSLGLLTSNEPQIFPGDRIEAIEAIDGTTQDTFPNPPGLFVLAAKKAGYGLNPFGSSQYNIVDLICDMPQQGGAS